MPNIHKPPPLLFRIGEGGSRLAWIEAAYRAIYSGHDVFIFDPRTRRHVFVTVAEIKEARRPGWQTVYRRLRQIGVKVP